MFAKVSALGAFLRTKHLAQRLKTESDVATWQARGLRRFLCDVLPQVPFYATGPEQERNGARSAEALRQRLAQLPVMEKAKLLASFETLNTAGLTLTEVRAALDRGEDRIGRYLIGQSTGTSGNRGVYVLSEKERFTWLGVILAKTLPDFPFARHRVALALPTNSRLYQSAAETGRLVLRFFDLALGVDRWLADLRAFAPDVIVAPPKVLRAIAAEGLPSLRHVFSGAEVLDPLDRAAIEAAFGVTVREIYMATEGLFGVACPHGVIHLAEEFVAFEWERPDPQSELVAPIVTDFTRTTQIMARYRMNDLLKLRSTPCPCGSPLRAVERIEGRRDDVFHLPRGDGGTTEARSILVTPDVIRNAIVDADRRILDFRAVQTGERTIDLAFAADLPAEAAAAAQRAVADALGRLGASEITLRLVRGIVVPFDAKLRRVRREWQPLDGTGRPVQ